MERHDYGFVRTVCACETCRANCRHLSGVVSPCDLKRWERQYGATEDIHAWYLTHLAASPGARVLSEGVVLRLPTIVPLRLHGTTQRCHWLTAAEACSIHNSAPFGCAFFDCQQSAAVGQHRSDRLHLDIFYDYLTWGPYRKLWTQLHANGNIVDAPEQARAAMAHQAQERQQV